MIVDIDKNTYNDLRTMLSESVQGWVCDFDEEYVYFERWDDDSDKYKTYKAAYTKGETFVEVSEDVKEVVRLTEFKEVEVESEEEVMERSLTKAFTSLLSKHFGGSNKEVQLIKQFDEEEMVAIEPLYIKGGDVDLQGDTASDEVIRGMVDSLNKAVTEQRLQMGIAHKHKTDSCEIVKAWVNETECTIGETLVPEGQPIAKVKFNNEAAWELRKSGQLTGLSIGARGTGEVLDD